MSQPEEVVEQAVIGQQVDATETKARRRARSIVTDALLSAGSPLENRGLTQSILPGLWNAAANVLIEFLQPSDVVALLTDRQRGILGNGDNAASPPRTIPAKQMDGYRKQVSEAGQTIMECLVKALEKLEQEGMEDRFPETVLDSALIVLLKTWGPDHVRRAMTEQSALIIRGVFQPVNFMEPVNFMPPSAAKPHPEPEPRKIPDRAPASEPHEAVPKPLPRRSTADRHVTAYVSADLSGDGNAAWAVSLVSMGTERSEERLVYGKKHDSNGRSTWLVALHECLLSVCADSQKARVKIEIEDEQMVRAFGNEPGTRYPEEESTWADIDNANSGHDVTLTYVARSISNVQHEKCDRKIRELLAG